MTALTELATTNYFAFAKLGEAYLVSNDTGRSLFVDLEVLHRLATSTLPMEAEVSRKLAAGGFVIQGEEALEDTARLVRNHKSYLFAGTQLHIFVLTHACNYACRYCQASARPAASGLPMTREVAERAVQIALAAPCENIGIEFQGGEPLLAFETLAFVVQQASAMARATGKQVSFSVVSNLALLDERMLTFFLANGVHVTTSLDGPRDLHNRNRPSTNGDSYLDTTAGLELVSSASAGHGRPVAALMTTTRDSLTRGRDIIDEYVTRGLSSIFLRPLTPLGRSAQEWRQVGYEPEHFVSFYAECLQHITGLNSHELVIREVHTEILLRRILGGLQPNYMELRSPCGGALGQLAYDCDGSVYTCDEGRMLAATGDDSFLLGNVEDASLQSLLQHPASRTVCAASCTESIPGCSDCVFAPYCGTCPVVNIATGGSIYPKLGAYRCRVMRGMLEVLLLELHHGRIPESMIPDGLHDAAETLRTVVTMDESEG